MNVNLEKTSDVDGVITVNVVEADYADKVNAELKKIAKTRAFPGFRQGHVPAGQVKRMFGKEVKSDVLNREVYNATIKYITDNKIEILGEPLTVNVQEVDLDQPDYTFKYEVGIAPKIDVVVDKSVTLPYYDIEVSDKMIEDQDKELRQRLASQEPGEEVVGRALVKGTLMQLNADGTINENQGAIQVLDGIVAPFLFKSDSQRELFMGKKIGDKVKFNPYDTCDGNPVELASMLHLDKDIAKDIKDDFEMAISEIIVAKEAEHNQTFYDTVFGPDRVHDEEEYKKAVAQMIKPQLVANSNSLFARTASDYLTEKYGNMELPTEFLKKWLVRANDELTDENIDEEYKKMLPSLKWQLIKDRVARELDVHVNEDDVLAFAREQAQRQLAQYGITNADEQTIDASARQMLQRDDYRRYISETVADNKLYGTIHQAVTIEHKPVSLDEFKAIVDKLNKADEQE